MPDSDANDGSDLTTVRGHLTGKLTAGIYPLLQNDTCYFVVADFDDAEWREDAKAFVAAAADVGVVAALEISRSGQGAHAWIFFAGATSARDARRSTRTNRGSVRRRRHGSLARCRRS